MVLGDLRHTCEQNEGMAGYGWTQYDPRTGDFDHNWGVRIKGEPRSNGPENLESIFVFYVGTEKKSTEAGSTLQCKKQHESRGPNAIECAGQHSVLGSFRLQIRDGPMSAPSSDSQRRTVIRSDFMPSEGIWQAKREL